MLHILCLSTRQETTSSWFSFPAGGQQVFLYNHATGSSFPAVVHKGLLTFLVLNWVFFTSWCFTNFLLAMATKKKWPLVMKHINWVAIIKQSLLPNMVHITSLVMDKMQFKQFPHYKSMGAFCCHVNQTKRQINIILAILHCPYPSNICTKLESYCFSGFEVVI